MQLWLYGRSHPDDNHYAHPIDVVVLVDLNLKKARPNLSVGSADLKTRMPCARTIQYLALPLPPAMPQFAL